MSGNDNLEPMWISTTGEGGRVYYLNKITGLSQWEKPAELGGAINGGRGVVPPPRPKSVAAPPPKPKTSVKASPSQVTVPAAVSAGLKPSVVKEMLLGDSQASRRDPVNVSKGTDPDTGFGDWEDVVLAEPEAEEVISEVNSLRTILNEDDSVRNILICGNQTNLAPADPVAFNSVVVSMKKKLRRAAED